MKTNVDNPFQATLAEITTQTDVTAARFLNGTVFQNTSNKPMLCLVSVDLGGPGKLCTIKCDANATPTTTLCSIYNGNLAEIDMMMSFVVLPGYYYKAAGVNGPDLISWIEYV